MTVSRPTRPGPLHTTWFLVTLVATVSVLLVMLTAGARADDAGPAVTGLSIRTDGGPITTSVTVDGLYPSATREAVVFLDGPRTEAVHGVTIAITNLVDLENGCNRPERHTGDTSCGDGDDQGELSGWLDLRLRSGVEVVTVDGRACRLTADAPEVGGLLADLAAADAPLALPSASTAAGDVLCVVTAFHHEERGPQDNLTQTDLARFDVTLILASDLPGSPPDGTADDGPGGDDTIVGGVVDERDTDGVVHDGDTQGVDGARDLTPGEVMAAGGRLTVGLGRTGADPLRLVTVGGLLLAAGAWVVARRPGGRTSTVEAQP